MRRSQRILITGASGLLGGNMVHRWSQDHEILGLDRNPFGGHPVTLVDLLDRQGLTEIVKGFGPTLIVNSAAMANVDACEKEPDTARAMNVDLIATLSELARETGAPLVHISTDQVFDGASERLYSEADTPAPINEYGRSKLAGEAAALEYERSLVVRTNIFGWNLARNKGSFGEWLYDLFDQSDEATLFTDVFFTPIYIGALLDCIEAVLERSITGVLHLVGATSLSKDRFGRLLAQQMGRDDSQVRSGTLADVALQAPRPKHMSLSSARFEELTGMSVPTAEESVRRFLADRQWLPVARDKEQ